MPVFNKLFIVSLHIVDKKEDKAFRRATSLFGKTFHWEYNGKKVNLNDLKKSHYLNDDIVYCKPHLKVSFANGEVIKIYKNTIKEVMEKYKDLAKYIEKPLFL